MVDENGRRTSNRQRKRSWTLVGITSSLAVIPTTTNATPLFQFHVPAARREVGYLEKTRASHLDRIWIPPREHRERYETESRKQQQFHQQSRLDDAIYSHILADASFENPDDAFQTIRQKIIDSKQPLTARKSEGSEHSANQQSYLRRARSTTVSTNPVLSQSRGGTGFINTDDTTDDQILNQTDYNVTAGIVYNVQPQVGQGQGNPTNDSSTVLFTNGELTHNASAIPDGNEELFRPIRIRAFLSEIEGGGEWLSDLERRILFEDILKPALLVWSSALRVEPVQGNLTVDRAQLVDHKTCGPGRDSGLPSVLVPPMHMTVGVPNTDMLVYLNLQFVNTNRTRNYVNPTNNFTMFNFSTFNFTADEQAQQQQNETNNNTSTPQPIQDKPITIQPIANFTSALNSYNSSPPRAPYCTGEYLAASIFCSTDQYDRPTAAMLNICIDYFFFDPSMLHLAIMTIIHEMGHALGFNSLSLAHFRRPDGSPVTPRVNGQVPLTRIQCAGPESTAFYANVSLPSKDILQFRSVRGAQGNIRVAEIVTPYVTLAARNHFNCQTLPGAELESGQFMPLSTNQNATACIGDHWERRLFKTDIMNPIVEGLDFNPRLSTLTLAYFADSGWYQVDLSRASMATGWGRGAGCSFVTKPCISRNGTVPTGMGSFFCNDNPALDASGFATDIQGCTADLSRKAACGIGVYNISIPIEYQYFRDTYGADVGGIDPFMDYCPVFNGFSNGLCSDPQNEALIRVATMENIGQRNSRCLSSQLQAAGSQTALCLPIACVVADRTFRIQLDGNWEICSFKNDVLYASNGDVIYCPDPIRICPTFYCDRDCLGTKQICNYTLGTCVCNNKTGPCNNGTQVSASFYEPPESAAGLLQIESTMYDYYVTSMSVLVGQKSRKLPTWHIVLMSVGGSVLVVVIIFFLWWRHKARPGVSDAGDGTDDAGGQAPNPNKDKMIASIVVDMRMRDPNLQNGRAGIFVDRSSETDLSMTDTDGEADSRNDSMELDEELEEDADSQGLYMINGDPLAPVGSDPLAPPHSPNSDALDPPCTVRRRKHTLVLT